MILRTLANTLFRGHEVSVSQVKSLKEVFSKLLTFVSDCNMFTVSIRWIQDGKHIFWVHRWGVNTLFAIKYSILAAVCLPLPKKCKPHLCRGPLEKCESAESKELSSMIQLRWTAISRLFLSTVRPGMTRECLCPTLWKEVWLTLMADSCRATRSCQSMVRMSGRLHRKLWLHYSRYIYRTGPQKDILSEWHNCFKLPWMTILKITYLVF